MYDSNTGAMLRSIFPGRLEGCFGQNTCPVGPEFYNVIYFRRKKNQGIKLPIQLSTLKGDGSSVGQELHYSIK